jgi:hypothetical protein
MQSSQIYAVILFVVILVFTISSIVVDIVITQNNDDVPPPMADLVLGFGVAAMLFGMLMIFYFVSSGDPYNSSALSSYSYSSSSSSSYSISLLQKLGIERIHGINLGLYLMLLLVYGIVMLISSIYILDARKKNDSYPCHTAIEYAIANSSLFILVGLFGMVLFGASIVAF